VLTARTARTERVDIAVGEQGVVGEVGHDKAETSGTPGGAWAWERAVGMEHAGVRVVPAPSRFAIRTGRAAAASNGELAPVPNISVGRTR
jgi:hypothetical protein